jgi:DNA-binding SARP family transcriptional activator
MSGSANAAQPTSASAERSGIAPVTANSSRPTSAGPWAAGQAVRLRVLGCWRMEWAGQSVPFATNAQRLIALLALRGPLPRAHVAGTLWPEGNDANALGSLRATLSRLRHSGLVAVSVDGPTLALDSSVAVDVHEFEQTATTALHGLEEDVDSTILQRLLWPELLPGWYDDWVMLERERLRQLRLHALERVSGWLCDRGRYPEALEAALATVYAEPLRESAHRAVIRVHLAESNPSEVVRQFEMYRRLLRDELGLPPSRTMMALLDEARHRWPSH